MRNSSLSLSRQRELRWILIIALIGLILRIAAASGALWLDEAWSATMADDVRTPLGVFWNINHDNNHHLNSLWLQTVGIGAPPVVARALSIISGSLSILVAGLIGARRGAGIGIVTALLFALSPVLVTLGSEARGYAPMTLMVLICIWYIDRWLAGDESANRPITLAICFFVGALFQLTMAFAACALIGWPLLALWQREGWRTAARKTALLFGPAVAALALAIAIVFAPALIEGTEFRFGSKQPFTMLLFLKGLVDLFGFTLGIPFISFWAPAATIALLILARTMGTQRLVFYWLAIVAFPLTVAALHMVNVGHPRYYLLVAIAMLLLIGEAAGHMIRAGRGRAVAAGAALLAFSGASVAADLSLIRNQRGDTMPAIRTLAARAPAGTRLLIGGEAGAALVKVSAAEAGYPIEIAESCPAARFLFVDGFKGEPGGRPSLTRRCGVRYRSIANAEARGMSGQSWTLYERVD